MKKTLWLFLIGLVANLAFGQATLPPCNAPAVTTNCTDYFGVANYANSPLPAGTITGFTIMAGGSGYMTPTVVITDPTGSGATATPTVDSTGAITGVNVATAGGGYIAPVVTIVDGGTTGSGAMVTATIGGPFTGGMRKFVDALATLPLAVADTTTFPGSDFYVIALTQYQQKMHTDLPATTLRGYVQLNSGSSVPSYLGPVIVAQKNKPVRILFKNMLPTTATGGKLFIPVDTTYMGAGPGYTENRATLHLHGGNTPWISDGTPHQWTAPPGETGGQARGLSTQFVPDMWFDGGGNVIATCAGQPICAVAGATNDPGAGNMTFFWTNQQGGRLMFYHDHAYGITRLNVYAGEAAGYLLYDPAEENALANATAPGTVTTGDLGHLIPLVIQDKTFVPSAAQLNAEDPTWITGNFGTMPGTANLGDLWFPHVYVPNQDPVDPDGVNAYGRWDYGPWFFPPQTSLTAGPITVPCTSAAFPGSTLGCPITPNPSGTPEGFMDTPVVNGVAYPVLHVAPAAYRFQILSAGNDRSWSLQLYVADATGKDVTMLPAVPPASGTALPLCSAPTNITSPALGIGLATGALDAAGYPLNGTGLPANCWPTSWPTDGRDGGVPDPRTAGPPFIQIGTEGGLLPAPVVIPSTPTGYEYNRRSVTVLNVATHGLWLGPAERADVLVDFSAFAGKTLILYNDAPAPAPAFDSRYDYYTGDPDQSSQGGAPSTQPGYGPNTRTMMQIVVDGNNPNNQTFSLGALQAAFASTAGTTGLFVSTQPTVIVPESTYNSAYHTSFTNTYSTIQAGSLTFTPISPQKIVQPGLGVAPCSATSPAICVTMEQKAIQELFTTDYGRMNATLGTELPLTSFLTQTTIPLGYIDPPSEVIQDGETQLWKITHNGVDTHFIHFHLFNVQVVNRMGWDGTVRPPDANELGWKDTVRMNPLEDIVVALQPIKPILPWPIPDSIRPMDVTAPLSPTTQFTGVDPFANTPAAVLSNGPTNFGWEYVWHCHILGHEENDMMRPIVFQVAPPAPSNLAAASDPGNASGVILSWTDNSANETGFTVQRDIDPAFPNPTTLAAAGPSSPTNAANQGTSWGGAMTMPDTPPAGIAVFYRVQAVDDGFKGTLSQLWNTTPALLSAWSNTAQVGASAATTLVPTALTFSAQLVNTTSAPQAVMLTNAAGAGTLAISGVAVTGLNPGDFAISANTCTSSLAGGANCTITVTFTPKAMGARAGTLSISSTNSPPLSVPLSGTAIAPVASVAPTALFFGNVVVGVTSTAQTVTLSNTGTAPLTNIVATISGGNAGDFTISSNTCTSSLAAPVAPATSTSCTILVTLKPATLGSRSSVLAIASSDPVNPRLDVSIAGVGIEAIAGVSPTSVTFPLQLVNTTSAVQTVTLSNTGNWPMTISSIAFNPATTADFVQFNNCPTVLAAPVPPATSTSCTISVNFRPTASGARAASLVISSDALVNPTITVPLRGTGTAVNLSTSALTFGAQLVTTTSATQTVTLTNVGTTTFTVVGISFTGTNAADFTQSNNCGGSLTAGQNCRISVRFKPTATGIRVATLQIRTSDLGLPTATVAVTGTGVASSATLSPTSLNFGMVTRGQPAGPLTVTLTNGGTAALIIYGVSIGGQNSFSQTNNCPIGGTTGLAIGASCKINVTFTPRQRGPLSATLQVTDNAPNSPQTVNLSGTGQ